MNKTIYSLFLLPLLLSLTSCISRKVEKPLWYYEESEQQKSQLAQQSEKYKNKEKELQTEIQLLEKQGAPITKIEPRLKERSELRAKIEEIEEILLGACRGYIDITSNPPGARIFINGDEQKPKTPAKFRASCRSHTVEVKKSGCKYRDNPREVIVEQNKTTKAHFESE